MAARSVGSVLKYPARAALAWYLGLVVVGSLLLLHPASVAVGRPPLSPLDALFTATSAVCVTGLTVRSTGNDFSWFGQGVLLLLIQLGGIGILTVTTYATLQFGGRASLRHRSVIAETLGSRPADDLRWVLQSVIGMVVICEGVGFCLLAVHHLLELPWPQALWHALFHSVAAFCNAGFGLHDDSLVRYQSDVWVNLNIMSLIVLGGIGFPVLLDLVRHRGAPWRDLWYKLRLHTKLVLCGTAWLIASGTAAFLILEQSNVLSGMSPGRALLVATFHSVTARTAGFNTVDVASLTQATLFITVILMAIGASPCSTGGGFKVSTFMVFVLLAWSRFRGSARASAFRRSIPAETVDRSVATVLLFAAVIMVVLCGLLVTEGGRYRHDQSGGLFLGLMFEAVSALGTVGLSTGVTPNLSEAGRLLVILLMLVGRLGPISVFAALSRDASASPIRYPKEDVLIG